MEERRDNGDACHRPVVMMEAPVDPIKGDFYDRLLGRLGVSYRSKRSNGQKRRMIAHALDEQGTCLLLIDEIQHIVVGDGKRERRMRDVIKSLHNMHDLAIVAFGIEDAINGIGDSKQLRSRFSTRYTLRKWKMGEDAMRLLARMEQFLPLRSEPHLADWNNPEAAEKILDLSEGTISEIKKVLRKAATKIIKGGITPEQITPDLIEPDVIGYTRPSKRNSRAWDDILGKYPDDER